MRRLLLISNSTLHGSGYLDHCKDAIKEFLSSKVRKVLFVPYALHNRDEYTASARKAFSAMGYMLESIHERPSAVEAVRNAEALFIGGGNTFLLLKTLYDENIVTEIRRRVFDDGMPYIGSSAGTNVATISINTTNDMPIVYPPTFEGIGLVKFNINPHYLDPDPSNKHMGETREQRISQFHEYDTSPPVLGLREGCILHVEGNKATVKGSTNARLFIRDMLWICLLTAFVRFASSFSLWPFYDMIQPNPAIDSSGYNFQPVTTTPSPALQLTAYQVAYNLLMEHASQRNQPSHYVAQIQASVNQAIPDQASQNSASHNQAIVKQTPQDQISQYHVSQRPASIEQVIKDPVSQKNVGQNQVSFDQAGLSSKSSDTRRSDFYTFRSGDKRPLYEIMLGSGTTQTYTSHEYSNFASKDKQCSYEGKHYGPLTEISNGRSGDWCYGTYCSHEGKVVHWDDFNCPLTIKPTHAPSPPPPPQSSNAGCEYYGIWYPAGSDIDNYAEHGMCYGTYCDWTSNIVHWKDSCYATVPSVPMAPTPKPDIFKKK